MALALARKYRPKRFADVAVQSHVATTLKGAIARGRVAHGYLLCGPRGVGKTTLARVLAMALNCERRGDPALDGEPCGECTACTRIWSGSTSLDVVEIDAASNRGVDDARDLRERAMYAPSGDDRYKVYIVDEAHMLTREAWNALLKILEEPPPRVVFVFATTEPQKIAQAAAPVLSRLQRFDFKRIGPGDIKDRLARVLASESVKAEPDALAMIARAADGSMRDALSLTDQVLSMGEGEVSAERVREALGLVPEDEFLAVLDLIAERRAADVFPVVARLADAGIDFGGFLTGLADLLRAQLTVVLGGTPADVSERAKEALGARRERFTASDLLRMLGALTELEPLFKKSGQQQLLLETTLVRFALLDRSVDLEALLRGLGEGDAAAGGGARREAGGTGAPFARPEPLRGNPEGPGSAPIPQRATTEPPATRHAAVAQPTEAPPPVGRSTTVAQSAPVAPSTERIAAPPPQPLDLHRLTGQWDQLVERMLGEGKKVLATALQHATPVAVTADGAVTIELDEPNAIYERAFDTGRPDVLAALRESFQGVARVTLKTDGPKPTAPPKRVTHEMIRSERLAALRKRDPTLGAAIDELDLDVVD